jgi:hypothetical protein
MIAVILLDSGSSIRMMLELSEKSVCKRNVRANLLKTKFKFVFLNIYQ